MQAGYRFTIANTEGFQITRIDESNLHTTNFDSDLGLMSSQRNLREVGGAGLRWVPLCKGKCRPLGQTLGFYFTLTGDFRGTKQCLFDSKLHIKVRQKTYVWESQSCPEWCTLCSTETISRLNHTKKSQTQSRTCFCFLTTEIQTDNLSCKNNCNVAHQMFRKANLHRNHHMTHFNLTFLSVHVNYQRHN